MVNYQKSSICYSRNTTEDDRDVVAQTLGVVQAPNFGKYLGLPAFVGRNKKAAFAYIEDKIKQRIGSWNKKLLSQAGKEILLKSAWDKLCIPKKYGGLSFKDLRAFNLAMLGKQACRLLTNPDSLVSRIYKARYFCNRPFTEACLGNNPSYCWRSIMAAKDLIVGGVRRRIGNGNSTLIWKDPWLQDEMDPMVQTEMPPQLLGAKVAGLIDQTTGTWDLYILSDIFDPHDVPRILKIPISPKYEDTWYWYDDPNGCYSLKNGYRHMVGIYENNAGFDKWNTLWKLQIPPKWRMLLRRAISNILPTTNNLLIKRVDVDPIRAMCGLNNEDIMHSLVMCDYAKSIWNHSGLPLPHIVTNIFHEWFRTILNVLDSNEMLFAAGILYNIWRARNVAVWDAGLPLPRRVLASAVATTNAWQAVNAKSATAQEPSHVMSGLQSETIGAPYPSPAAIALPQNQPAVPPPSQPKLCYIDAGYGTGLMTATAGVVLFDHLGNYISAYCVPPQTCFSPLMVEALACKEALSWLKDRGEQAVQIFTDCQTLRAYLDSTVRPRSYLGYVLDECRRLMTTFHFCSVNFIPRSQNITAHALASSAFTFSTAMYWDEVPPDSISTHI
ncbi:PREDICTED: uncharacterized protein LOC109170737 [Ipomoea nil]|uniref:uncharacterized protein LOC109170737 n=1 Tax=Ipomoea nil TaxID=35883 RepID=UPI000901050C|nr:PREDICTED: uncharacterized protein LOC109170737 [Ipomoea nil]